MFDINIYDLGYCKDNELTRVVCVSKAVATHFENITGRKDINIIYNGVDSNKFNENIPCDYLKKELKIADDEILFGMIGRINAWKGQEDFLIAAEKVLANTKKTKALIVGGVFAGEEWRKVALEEKINNSKFKKRIILSDFRKDAPNIHRMLDIFVLPSTNPDPLPTVILESMACGNPIVAYRHGGVCEMVKEGYNGYFAEIRNPSELADKIIELINNPKVRRKMGNNSIKRQKDLFSLDAYIKNFESLYKKLN